MKNGKARRVVLHKAVFLVSILGPGPMVSKCGMKGFLTKRGTNCLRCRRAKKGRRFRYWRRSDGEKDSRRD